MSELCCWVNTLPELPEVPDWLRATLQGNKGLATSIRCCLAATTTCPVSYTANRSAQPKNTAYNSSKRTAKFAGSLPQSQEYHNWPLSRHAPGFKACTRPVTRLMLKMPCPCVPTKECGVRYDSTAECSADQVSSSQPADPAKGWRLMKLTATYALAFVDRSHLLNQLPPILQHYTVLQPLQRRC
jgi:hypothetical protein